MNAESVTNSQETPVDTGHLEAERAASGASAEAARAAEIEKLTAEKAELQDRVLRTQAEFQNYRRRIEKEKIELLEYASTEAVRALLPVLDDFERALRTDTSEKEYAKGIELIYQRLFDGLKKLGLEPIVAEGKPFDPHVHEAVDRVEVDDVSTETVLSELQRGYNFKGRLLRPAMVRVGVPSTR